MNEKSALFSAVAQKHMKAVPVSPPAIHRNLLHPAFPIPGINSGCSSPKRKNLFRRRHRRWRDPILLSRYKQTSKHGIGKGERRGLGWCNMGAARILYAYQHRFASGCFGKAQ